MSPGAPPAAGSPDYRVAAVLRRLLLCAWGPMLMLQCGCSAPGYYWQAAKGQLGLMRAQREITAVIADPNTAAEVRQSLERVVDIRRFATEQLHLPAQKHYHRYADLRRSFVVWNVTSTPEFSLESRTWWYPLVGRLKYRGYFEPKLAELEAGRLRRRGNDVHVGGVQAYSTLGWFSDPVLNTFILSPPAELAEILFHELAHQRLFVSGDTDFNEAFATAVAREGVRRWLRSDRGKPDEVVAYDKGVEMEEAFASLVQSTREALKSLYSQSGELPIETLRQRKRIILDGMVQSYGSMRGSWAGKSPYDGWFSTPINNAKLNSVASYLDLVPAFDRLLQQEGGDFEKFYSRVAELGRMPAKERKARLSARGHPHPSLP